MDTNVVKLENAFEAERDADTMPEATPSPTAVGHLELIDRGQLWGWVSDPGAPEGGVDVEMFEGNRLVGRGHASTVREDLRSAGYGSGTYGFCLPLDPSLYDGRPHRLTLRVVRTGAILPAQTMTVAAEAESRIESIDAGTVRGSVRIVDGERPEASDVDILADGRVVAGGVCHRSNGSEHYGFEVALPDDLFDDIEHVIECRLRGRATIAEPRSARLPSLVTPWEHLRTSTGTGTLDAASPVAAWRYAALRRQIERFSGGTLDAGGLAAVHVAHAVVVEGHEGRAKFPRLELPACDSPTISIVVPVHDKFALTYHCIASLILAAGDTSFELIVVDDRSSDETVDIERHVGNVRVLRNESNLGFLLSCNAGARMARGDYVLLLNNDTEMTVDSLDAMRATFERYEKVGAVGAKLIYPDGRLQEAGGIVWGSGRPWNIGNGQNPADPRYCYTRQCDYLSGAALMLPREIWNEVGGLSEEFAPAYYEDTDLAFKVREAGLRTFYCADATVVHFEGMSNGRDLSSGMKRFQAVNAPRFRGKWRHAYRGNGTEGREIELNVDRGVDFRALVIDYAVPRPDHDAGSYAAVQEMRLLQELGCKVTFVPNNMAHMGHYTAELQAMGIECIHAPFFWSVGDFLQKRGREFDVVYITRYDIAEQVLPSVRAFTDAKVAFNNADLHFLRELRAAHAGGEADRSGPAATRERELSVMREVDAVLSYNEIEHSVIASHDIDPAKVFRCPWVLTDRRSSIAHAEREGIAFLGGFRHEPNREAVRYFVSDVMPLLRIAAPEVRFHIYGSAVTPDIQALACDDVIVEGFVEELSDVFDRCRVFVAPLLSGAGIKGKVLESIAFGVPCVLSPVAAESTGLVDGQSAFIASEPEDWCERICRLYREEETWQRMSDSAHALVGTRYGLASGLEQMSAVLRHIELDPAERREPLFRVD